MTLYEVTADYLRIMEMMEDPELDPQTLADTMEAVEGELEVKVENYGKVIRNFEADIEVIKSEINRLTDRKKVIENSVKRMKEILQQTMETTGKTKIKTDLFNFSIRNNAPAVVVDGDIKDIPMEYLRIREPEVDKAKLKEDLKKGIDLEGVAHLERSTSIVIK